MFGTGRLSADELAVGNDLNAKNIKLKYINYNYHVRVEGFRFIAYKLVWVPSMGPTHPHSRLGSPEGATGLSIPHASME